MENQYDVMAPANDVMAQCDDLAQPMGDVIGAAFAVPVGAGTMVAVDLSAGPLAPVALPIAVGSGIGTGVGTFETVRDIVADNWHDAVCEPLANWAQPDSVPASPTPDYGPSSSAPDNGPALGGSLGGSDPVSSGSDYGGSDYGGGGGGSSGGSDVGGSD